MRQGYTRIPNALISDATLSLAARMVYVYIASQDKGWVFRPEVMERELGIKREYRFKLIKELIDAGKIIRTRQGNNVKYVAVGKTDSHNDVKVDKTDCGNDVAVGKTDSDHLINNKNIYGGGKNTHACARVTTTTNDSSELPEGIDIEFFTKTKEAATELECPPEIAAAFYSYWTAEEDGVPVWRKTFRRFNFKYRLQKWMLNERTI